jgi:hypothetical protein
MGQKRQGIEKNINGRGCPKATTTGGAEMRNEINQKMK